MKRSIMASTSFVKSRRGILQHLEEGRLSLTDYAVFSLLVILADKATGVCWVSSAVIAGKFADGSLAQSTAKDALRRLKDKGYIKEFRQQGSRGSYPVLVNKYEITVGNLTGCLTNAEQTVDWRQPAVSGRPENGPESGRENGRDTGRDSGPPYTRPQEDKTTRQQETVVSSVDVSPPERREPEAAPTPKAEPAPKPATSQPPAELCSECHSKVANFHVSYCSQHPNNQHKQPADNSAPAKPRDPLRDWNEDVGEFPAERIRRAIRYQLDVAKNPWYTKTITVAFVRRAAKKLVEDTPPQYLASDDAFVKPVAKVLKYTLPRAIYEETARRLGEFDCPTCHYDRGIKNSEGKWEDCPGCDGLADKFRKEVMEETR
jgi:DNA-binding transcriptional ArsR family regulator